MAQDLIGRDDFDQAKLSEILQSAYFDTEPQSDGRLLVKIDGMHLYGRVEKERALMSLTAGFNVKPGATREEMLELCNRINDELVLIRACCPKVALPKLLLWLDHWIDTGAGVIGAEVVDEVRRFRAVINSVSQHDTEGILA